MKTRFIRVAKSGKTVDGREITPDQIDQMAASYNPATYGARIWLEHYRSMLPDGPFKAYGDVLAVKADSDPDGSRVLLAQMDATQDLVNLLHSRQKVYWSIELDPNFAGTNTAYLVGLSATDSPASLGTEMLTFAVKAADANQELKNHLFSAYVEAAFAAEDAQTQPEPGFLTKMREFFSGAPSSPAQGTAAGFDRIASDCWAIAEALAAQRATAGVPATAQQPSADVAALAAKFDALVETLSKTSPSQGRPPVSGSQPQKTDC